MLLKKGLMLTKWILTFERVTDPRLSHWDSVNKYFPQILHSLCTHATRQGVQMLKLSPSYNHQDFNSENKQNLLEANFQIFLNIKFIATYASSAYVCHANRFGWNYFEA